jgi:hypothetical protein
MWCDLLVLHVVIRHRANNPAPSIKEPIASKTSTSPTQKDARGKLGEGAHRSRRRRELEMKVKKTEKVWNVLERTVWNKVTWRAMAQTYTPPRGLKMK